ncbi:MAG: outer membrane protein assembly factor BamB [Kiritimatiellia bacterium]|jgi:outer membrane protein assembly factor BamB
MKQITHRLILAILFTASLLFAQERTWTARNGKTMQASFVRVEGDKVVLKVNSREGRVPIANFIEADQAFIRAQAGARLGAAATVSSGWTRYRGPNCDGIAPDQGLTLRFDPVPKLLWAAEGFGRSYASISIAGDRIYTTGNSGSGQTVFAAARSDGEILWETKLTDKDPDHGSNGSRCTPTIDGDQLYVVTSDGGIAAVRAQDGKITWQHSFSEWGGRMMSSWGFSESPLVDGDVVICQPGGEDAVLVALDKATGRVKWKSHGDAEGDHGKDGAGYGCIVVSNAGGIRQYVCFTGRGVIGVRASDGRFLWGYNRIANSTANIATPIVIDDYVFCSSGYGTGSALLKLSKRGSGIDAEEIWWADGNTLQNHHGGMVHIGDHIYMGHKHNSGFPTCIEWRTGNIVWGGKENRGPGSGSAAVLYADGHLIFRYEDGLVALIEATPDAYNLKGAFKPAYQTDKSWAHPVVFDGKLYLREQGRIMCYDLKS